MVTQGPSLPSWVDKLPSAYDIVAAYYPETKPKGDLRLRPCLVTQIVEYEDGTRAPMVVFGTKHLKIPNRLAIDIIVQNARHIAELGLAMATRFDLDSHEVLPWHPDFFGCWTGRPSPVIGTLTEHYIKDYAWKMFKRRSV